MTASAVESAQGPVNDTPDGTPNSNPSNAKPPQADEDEDKFPEVSLGLITNYPEHWCCFDYTGDDDGTTSLAPGVGSPPPHDKLISETSLKWASGTVFLAEFLGPKIFAPDWTPDAGYSLPTFLYDIVTHRVIETSTLSELAKKTRYATISHVWGNHGIELDGTPYGVPGPILIRYEEKLIRMLEAARVLVGECYVWIDILCLEQYCPSPHERQAEVAEMGRYFRNATGCFVWMDDAFEKMDRHGLSMNSASGAADGLVPSAVVGKATDEMRGPEALGWIQKVRKVERAPWFRLQCRLVGLVEATARRLLSDGAMESIEIIHELHGSEVYKILKLRQLYQHDEVGFWHIAQAVRSRSCTPILDHRMESGRILGETWEQALLESDFSALIYLGERSSVYSMFADPLAGMPFISIGTGRKPDTAPRETHRLKLVDGVAIKDVGGDRVRSVTGVMCTALERALKEWMMTQTPFEDMDMETHLLLATAWALPKHTQSIKGKNGDMKHFSPGAYAAFLSLAPSWATPILGRLADKEFSREVKRFFPTGDTRKTSHSAAAYSASIRVGLISEPPDNTVIALTPGSYHNHPGPGCLLVKVLEDGVFHKIGIGLGKAVSAHSFVSGQIIPPPRIPGLPWVYVPSSGCATQE
ncbi:hypothetical protein PENFLA_c061G10251 [Penicillium flavigenum]|uniref:Heterokaryon incompatibility domain-containing protein n=1 Tax=Penicillium flavigenum TaxID=254877 RepID=A0A1V6SGF5_9EURO|nr:hypothetical protein PENFLA_c061G10251 [Penicillium flavigenum]